MKKIEEYYQMYLQLVQLKESDMGPNQKIETRRAFFGGFGMCLEGIRDEISEDEDEAIKDLEGLQKQYNDYWINQKLNLS